MVLELFHEVGAEIAAEPVTFAIEVVQFVLLIAIVWVIAFGFGNRRGFVSNMLAERRNRVARELEEADGAEAVLETARCAADAAIAQARADAERQVADARTSAEERKAAAFEADEREAEAQREHARHLLEMEREEMLAEAREQLLEVVGSATRHILSERLSPAEQRALVQRAIMATLETPHEVPAARTKAAATASSAKSVSPKPSRGKAGRVEARPA